MSGITDLIGPTADQLKRGRNQGHQYPHLTSIYSSEFLSDVIMSTYSDWELPCSGPGQQGGFYEEDLNCARCNEADKRLISRTRPKLDHPVY